MTTDTADIHSTITDAIVAAIEAGAGEWQMPWHKSGNGLHRPVNIDTGKRYRGVNILSLWASSQRNGFTSGTWGTYKQWQARGAQVRKGMKGTPVVFYKTFEVETQTDAGDAETSTRMVARGSYVFNADQVDGYTAPPAEAPSDPVSFIDTAEAFIRDTGATIRFGGNAYYSPTGDFVNMPHPHEFIGTATSTAGECYYSTILHELAHWTSPAKRCDRQLGKRFGDAAYAMEELVAELAAAFLCADLGITSSPRPDHASYIQSWLRVLKADKKAIFTAASAASKACDYLDSLQSDTTEDAAEAA